MASGVDREPGATTASVTPGAHPLVDQRGGEGRGHGDREVGVVTATAYVCARWPPVWTPRYAAEVARLGLVHGFTQNRRCWGGFADTWLAPISSSCWSTHPVTAARPTVIADVANGAALVGDAGRARRATSATRWADATRCGWRSTGPTSSSGLVLIGASPGSRRRGRARAATRRRRRVWPSHLEAIGVAAFLDEWLAQPIFAGLPAEARFRDGATRRTRSPVSRPACASRAPARRNRCGTAWRT